MKRYLGKKIPWDKFKFKEYVNGTNNEFAFIYLPEFDLTFQSFKGSNVIVKFWKGKHKVTEKENSMNWLIKNKDSLKWYQKLYSKIISNVAFIITYILMFPVISVLYVTNKVKKK